VHFRKEQHLIKLFIQLRCASLATANDYVQPGDTVYLRVGTYQWHIKPARGRTNIDGVINKIVYAAYDRVYEPVIIDNDNDVAS